MADFMIIGLGNPGRHFRGNRHNAGYMLIDYLLEAYDASLNRSVSEALITEIEIDQQTVILAKPQTYMNESGRSVASLVRAFKPELSTIMIAFDELDLDLGTLRMRPAGGSSGHRGMRSIINHLGTQEFPGLGLESVDRLAFSQQLITSYPTSAVVKRSLWLRCWIAPSGAFSDL